jgi:hypothetical protein
MLEYQNNNIFTGYLKQLLKDFNLPKYRIYSNKYKIYKNTTGKESVEILPNIKYIKNNTIEIYKDNQWVRLENYQYNVKKLNHTRNLKITNNIYDSYTHEYLGDYLRFQRDYNNTDLMPLYNCFNNKICTNLILDHYNGNRIDYSFNSFDSNYKIYIVPIKLFNEYTIAIDCNSQIELACCIYGKYLDDSFTDLLEHTYTKLNYTQFNHPFLFTKLKYDEIKNINLDELVKRENDLRLIIKVPINLKSSITILEGNYLNWNDNLATIEDTKLRVYKNHTITNYEDFDNIFNKQIGGVISKNKYEKLKCFTPITELQLLKYNTGKSYPLADRLIEYLLFNVITNQENIGDNIKRTQAVLDAKSILNEKNDDDLYSGIWSDLFRPELYYGSQGIIRKVEDKNNKIDVDGKKVNQVYYDMYYQNNKTNLSKNHDLLGYVDKDTEMLYTGTINKKTTNIANVDIYPYIYRDDKGDK